jgi:hypothetical protein
MANKPEDKHVSVHHEDSANNGRPPNQWDFTQDSIVRSLFPDTFTIDSTALAATITVAAPTPVAITDVINTTQQGGGRPFRLNRLEPLHFDNLRLEYSLRKPYNPYLHTLPTISEQLLSFSFFSFFSLFFSFFFKLSLRNFIILDSHTIFY